MNQFYPTQLKKLKLTSLLFVFFANFSLGQFPPTADILLPVDDSQCLNNQLFTFVSQSWPIDGNGDIVFQPEAPITYHWDINGEATSTDEVVLSHQFATPGLKEITLTATNMYGSTSASIIVEVLPLTPPQITQTLIDTTGGVWVMELQLTNPQDYTHTEPIFPNGGGSMSFDDPSTNTTHITYFSPGTYMGSTTVVNLNGCVQDNLPIEIIVPTSIVNSGNNGGIESESLGDAVSLRYFNRKVASKPTELEKTDDLIFNKTEASQSYQTLSTGGLSMIDMFPESLEDGDVAHVTSPTDILDFTIAREVFSVDYSVNNRTRGVVLGVKTIDRSYNHTKASCDRLRGAEIQMVKSVEIQGYKFLMQGILQQNNVNEYAISFAIGKNQVEENYTLQSNWYVNAYEPAEEMYNFQVWTTRPEATIKLVNEILDNINADATIVQNEIAIFPKSYISKIERVGTELVLKLNAAEIDLPVQIDLEEIYSETHGYGFRSEVIVSEEEPQIIRYDVKDAYEFQGHIKVNDEIYDAFYHADGNWGLDFDANLTRLEEYRVYNNFERVYKEDEKAIHRNVKLEATSNDYLTLYKSLQPGNLPADYTDYNYVSFRAKGSGVMELGLIKSSVQNWNDQYRAMLNIRNAWHTYYVPFSFFKSEGNAGNLMPNDLSMLTFTFLPQVVGDNNLDLTIEDVKFTREAPEGYENHLSSVVNDFAVFPNPTNGNITCLLFSDYEANTTFTLRDTSGKVVSSEKIQIIEGRNEIQLSYEGVNPNMYFLSVENEKTSYGNAKIVIQ